MRPILASDNMMNSLNGHSKSFRNIFEDCSALAHSFCGRYVFIRKLPIGVSFSAKRSFPSNIRMLRTLSLPSLCYLISHIFLMSSKEKVIRIAAPLVIAAMQAVKAALNWSARKRPCHPMSIFNFSINPKRAVTTFRSKRLSIWPARDWSCRSVNFFPKSLLGAFESLSISCHKSNQTSLPNSLQSFYG